MNRKKLFLLLGILFLAVFLVGPQQASATAVDLELALLVDVSGSVDGTDFNLIRDGYEAAFRDASIISAIQNAGTYGSIAATLVYWSDAAVQSIDWMLINDVASSNAFAEAIANATRPYSGGTGMVNALNYSVPLFNNDFNGTRQVIDVTGDGSESSACAYNDPVCLALQAARDNAFANGIDAINALFVDDRNYFGDDPEDIINAIDYANTNLIGGPNAFVAIVQDYTEFPPAVKDKIGKEIQPEVVPEPATLMLIGSGLIGLAGFRKKFRRS